MVAVSFDRGQALPAAEVVKGLHGRECCGVILGDLDPVGPLDSDGDLKEIDGVEAKVFLERLLWGNVRGLQIETKPSNHKFFEIVQCDFRSRLHAQLCLFYVCERSAVRLADQSPTQTATWTLRTHTKELPGKNTRYEPVVNAVSGEQFPLVQ